MKRARWYSVTGKAVPFKAPRGFDLSDARLVLRNDRETDAVVTKPYEARVYLRNK